MLNKIKQIPDLLNNRIIYLVGIGVLVLLLLKQCNETRDAKQEAERNFNNMLAERDSVRVLKSKNGNMLAEKAAFKLKYDELSSEQKELIKRLELSGKKKPGVVIQTDIVYKDTSILVPVLATLKDGEPVLNFKHNPTLPGKNKLLIEGLLPYLLITDTIQDSSSPNGIRLSSRVEPGIAKLSMEQKIDLVTGLYTDPKTGRIFVRASTTFPGITFSDMQALDMVDDPATKKALRQARKPFGIGFSLGWGMTVGKDGYNMGPNVGVGVTYTPTWLQFGK
jgi:hypothetical protein